jgi:HlyD family secretion protein
MTSNAEKISAVFSAKKPNKRGIRSRLIRGIICLLLIGTGYFIFNQAIVIPQQKSTQKIQTVLAERMDLPVMVSANGTVQAERSVNVSPKTAGILSSLQVKEGDRVEQGQLLAYMDDSNLKGNLLQQQANLVAAQATLKKIETGNRPEDIAQLRAKLNDAKFNLRQAESDLRRYQKLSEAGAISQQSYDSYLTTRDRSQAQVDEAEQALALAQKGSRQEDIDQARAQVVAAQGAVQTVQTQLDDTVIRAPFSGIVVRKYADPGSFVTPTTAGSSVSSATSSSILALASRNQIVAKVAETNVSRIRIGQTVTIQADAYPGKTFAGKVAQIASQSVVEQNVTSFEVKISLFDPQQLLRSGMSVEVTFNAGTLKQVLVVPTATIVRQDSAQGVFVIADDRPPVFVSITTGATVNDKTEVRSGLTENEQILLSFPQSSSRSKLQPPPGPPGF